MMISKIDTHDSYIEVMAQIEKFLQKATKNGGFASLTQEEGDTLQRLSLMAEAYEDAIPTFPAPEPQSIAHMLQIKMMEMMLKQKEMAALLNISESRLSEILSGKRKVNMELAKKLHQILKMEAEFILQAA